MANQILIQGAGQAVERFDKEAIAGQGIANIGATIAKGGAKIAEIIYDRGEEFDKAAKEALESGEFMEPERYKKLVQELMTQKEKYIWGSSTDRALLEQDLNKRTLELGEMEMLTTDIAELALKDEKQGGLRQSFKDSDNAFNKDVMEILNKKKEYVWNEERQSYGFNMRVSDDTNPEIEKLWEKYNSMDEVNDDGSENPEAKKVMDEITKLEKELNYKWMSRSEISDLIKKNSFNKTTHDLIGLTYASVAEAASKLKPNESRKFKDKVWSDWTLRNVVEADKHAAINDPLIANKSFKEHLFDHLKEKTYGDLELSREDLLTYEGQDPDGEGGLPPINIEDVIDENDARQLADIMCEDETNPALVGEGGLLQRFFTQHFRDAWKEGIKFTPLAEVPIEEETDFNPISEGAKNTNIYLEGAETDAEKKVILDLFWEQSKDKLDGDGGDQVRKTLEEYRSKYPSLTDHWEGISLSGGEGDYQDPEDPSRVNEFKGVKERSSMWGKAKDIRYYKYLYWKRFGDHITRDQLMKATNNWTDSWDTINKNLSKGFKGKK